MYLIMLAIIGLEIGASKLYWVVLTFMALKKMAEFILRKGE